MFSIFDGRKNFYQWDTGQRLIVNENVCSEVHFCNGMDDCALVCEIYEENGLRLVDVPNILFQSAEIIRVFAVVQEHNGKHTRRSQKFVVMDRTKPATYVYTETEVKSYTKLESRISALEKGGGGGTGGGGVSPEQLQEAVNDALRIAKESGEFDGQPGYTPQKGVDYFDGKPGVPGHTPEKGTDYWTPEDRAAMVQDVISALPKYAGEVENV